MAPKKAPQPLTPAAPAKKAIPPKINALTKVIKKDQPKATEKKTAPPAKQPTPSKKVARKQQDSDDDESESEYNEDIIEVKKPLKRIVSADDATKQKKVVKQVLAQKKPAAAPVQKKASQKKKKEEESDEEDGDNDYFLPGQIKATPDESDPVRIFYESLYRQRPDSQMAEVYCIEHGILTEDKAKEVIKRLASKGGARK